MDCSLTMFLLCSCLFPFGRVGIFEPLAAVQIFPPDFDVLPPDCLKKKATRSRSHWSRIPRIHSAEIGRWPGPLSPPTITQSIAFNGRRGKAFENCARKRDS